MRTRALILTAVLSAQPVQGIAGDAVAGKQKAVACVACHGNETFSGVFFTLQLAGRSADKLLIKSKKYKTGKIFHPVMNMATAMYTEQDLEDISTYYESLVKPVLNVPYLPVKGDDDRGSADGAAPGESK